MTEQQPETFPPATNSANVPTPPVVGEAPSLGIALDKAAGHVVLVVRLGEGKGATFPLTPVEAGNLALALVQHAQQIGGPGAPKRVAVPPKGLVLPDGTLRLHPRK